MKAYQSWLRLLWQIGRTRPVATAAALGLILVTGGQAAIELWTMQLMLDRLTAGAGLRQTLPALTLLLGSMLTGNVAERALSLLRVWLRQEAEEALTGRLLEQAGRLPLQEFESPATMDLMARARDGIKNQFAGALELTETISRNIVHVLAVLTTVALISPFPVLLLLGASLPGWLVNLRISRGHFAMYKSQTERERRATYFANLLRERSLAPELRIYRLTWDLLGRWRTIQDELIQERNRYGLKRLGYQVTSYAAGRMAFVGAAALLAAGALAGRLTAGQFGAALRAIWILQERTIALLFSVSALDFSSRFAVEYWEFVDRHPAPMQDNGAVTPFRGAGAAAVEFHDVSFTYAGAARPSLRSVSCHVRPGELIALVGENGAGKSTLVKLLLGLYPADGGRVRVAGVDPASAEGAGVRATMAPVFQEYLRYALSVGENIGVGDVAAIGEQSRIRVAAAAAGADAVAESRPRGYDTLLGREYQGGEELSGGQWQKLAIARAYMRGAAVLVLDEPTAALDPLAELEVFRRFKDLARGRTAFLVSHRLGAARMADRIFVLQEGHLVEAGNHAALMEQKGVYAKLFAAQSQWYR